MFYANKLEWRTNALKKYNFLTSRVTSRSIMLYSGGKLIAIFDRTKNQGVIFSRVQAPDENPAQNQPRLLGRG